MIVLVGAGLIGWVGAALGEESDRAGTFLAVQGTVTMQPASLTAPRPMRAYDPIGRLAVIETKAASRAKVLFADDTLITLGERSRLEMTEQTYRAGEDTRAFVAHLTRGVMRILVARTFPGENSIFEVHSRTAVATVRGTYFVMWIEEPEPRPSGPAKPGTRPIPIPDTTSEYEGATAVANIGASGDIAFTSGGATVLVLPGQSSVALPGGPPSMPTPIDKPITGPGPLPAAIAATTLADVPQPESPRAVIARVGEGEAGAGLSQPSLMAGAVDGQFSSGAYAVPGWPLPVTPVTPPAVVSGAAPTGVHFSIKLP
jgi:hypothetical protein